MVHDIIDWNRIRKLIIQIAEFDHDSILFDCDKAIEMGYSLLEQQVAEQVIYKCTPLTKATSIRLEQLFGCNGSKIAFLYLYDVQLIFIVLADKKDFVVIDEAAIGIVL
jgi:hypothetical protein